MNVRTLFAVVALSGVVASSATRIALAADTSPAPAASPSPASPAAGKPLRQLEYRFTADYDGTAEAHFSDGPGVVPVGNYATGTVSTGRRGTISVNVLGVAPDGSLAIGASEFIDNTPRAHQEFDCLVYGNTTVVCPVNLPATDAEYALLSYLGRRFVDGAPWDQNSHWQFKDNNQDYETTADFTLHDLGDGKNVLVTVNRKVVVHQIGYMNITDDMKVTYDRSMEIPTEIVDDRTTSYSGGSHHTAFTFKLVKDTFAKP